MLRLVMIAQLWRCQAYALRRQRVARALRGYSYDITTHTMPTIALPRGEGRNPRTPRRVMLRRSLRGRTLAVSCHSDTQLANKILRCHAIAVYVYAEAGAACYHIYSALCRAAHTAPRRHGFS